MPLERDEASATGDQGGERLGTGPDDANAAAGTTRFSSRPLRRAAALLKAAGLVDDTTVGKVEAATTPESAANGRPSGPVGARLDRARAKHTALELRRSAAEAAVRAAKKSLSDIKQAIAAIAELVKVLENEISQGERTQEEARSNDTLDRLTEMLTTFPDQTQWAFEARLLLQARIADYAVMRNEVDHRVKNNFQMILGLLEMQAARAAEAASRAQGAAGSAAVASALGISPPP